jgi:hypothetical protein
VSIVITVERIGYASGASAVGRKKFVVTPVAETKRFASIRLNVVRKIGFAAVSAASIPADVQATVAARRIG